MAKMTKTVLTKDELRFMVGCIDEQIDELQNKKQVLVNFLDGMVVYDDNFNTNKEVEVEALIEFRSSNISYVQHIPGRKDQQLYGLYYDFQKQQLHLSRVTIGGIFVGDVTDADAIEKYNSSCLFGNEKIKRIIFRDGSKIDIV